VWPYANICFAVMTERPLLELRALRVFVEVATSRSMSIAATRLGLTQSAVSQVVRRLEGDLGVALALRGSRPVALTEAGVMLYRRAEPLLRDAAQLAHAVAEAGSTLAPELRLGLVDTFASTAGPELIRVLTGAATRVVVWSGLAPSLGAALVGRQVDAIVTSDPLEDLDGLLRFALWREPFVLLLPRGRPAPASLSDLAAAL
jgi:DNA-binding transcriptional LysR family regulator